MLLPVSPCAVKPTTSGGAAPAFVPGDKIQPWCYTPPGGSNALQGQRTYTVNADGSISNEAFLDNTGAPIDPETVLKVPCQSCACAGTPSTPVTPEPIIESDAVEMCDNGVTFIRWHLKSNGVPTNVSYDTDKDSAPYTVSDEANVSVGPCGAACTPVGDGFVNPDFGFDDGPVPPSGLSYPTPSCVTPGFSATYSPTLISSGSSAVSYSVSPAVDGVSIDTVTGIVTFAPTGIVAQTTITVTATNAAGSATATLSVLTCPVEWTVERTDTTVDLLALYPSATAFRFKGVGGGGGGEGGPARPITSTAMYTKPGGSGGGVFDVTVPVSQITAAISIAVGQGGAGSTGATYNASTAQVALPGADGGASTVTIGATVLAQASGGYGGMDINKQPVWPKGGAGNLAAGGQAQGGSGAVAGQPNYWDTSAFDGAARNAGNWAAAAAGPGAGGTSAGFNTTTTATVSQPGQDSGTGGAGGAAGLPSTGNANLAIGQPGELGQALPDGTLTYGAGGGAGGLGASLGFRGGRGGNGGWPGAGGGAGGGGTGLNVNSAISGGTGGNGADGVVMWIPVF